MITPRKVTGADSGWIRNEKTAKVWRRRCIGTPTSGATRTDPSVNLRGDSGVTAGGGTAAPTPTARSTAADAARSIGGTGSSARSAQPECIRLRRGGFGSSGGGVRVEPRRSRTIAVYSSDAGSSTISSTRRIAPCTTPPSVKSADVMKV